MRSVVLKLFIVTAVMILLVFTVVMVAEGLFFERFYRSSKLHTLEGRMSELASRMQQGTAENSNGQSSLNQQQLSRLLGDFMNNNDASAAFLDRDLQRIAVDPYFIELKSGEKTISVRIPTEGMAVDAIPRGLQVGDELIVDGFFMDEKDTIMFPSVIQRTDTELQDGLVRVHGEIINLMLPEQRSYNPLYQDALINDALRDWQGQLESYQTGLSAGKVMEINWSDNWSGVEYAILVLPLSQVKGEVSHLFVMTSLQPVGEAVGILKQYYVYMAPILLVLVLVLSLIYSRLVSRPLVVLNKTAARLARLDFTEQPGIHSKDEFGELSRNLMTLSRNLDKALQELTTANAQLQEDVREKQRSEQLRKELVANISHELKTPLGIVKGFAEGLQDGVAEEKRERYLALIVHETDRMNALIMDMLELSKFEVKAVRLQPQAISLVELIQKVADSFTQQLEIKGLRISLQGEAGEQDLVVEADPRRMEQVLLNLFSNAIRHADESSTITINFQCTATGEVQTTMENVGPPIPEADLNRIWSDFYRVERSRDRKSGGTGLGLAIVKHILELHKSEFGAVNTARGVAFYFTLQEISQERGTEYE